MSETTSGERQSKKQKYGSQPGIASGIISASKSAAIEGSVTVEIKSSNGALSDFFEGGDDDSIAEAMSSYTVGQACSLAFADKKGVENRLRNAIFAELRNHHGLSFPDDSGEGQYKEKNLKKLFESFGHSFGEKLSVADKEQGFLITTTSSPDLCVQRTTAESLTEVKLGELKQGATYTRGSATRQGLRYLHALLYFYRVKLGIPVDSVYGFTVCGPKCSDLQDEYSVGLLKLSAPQWLGDVFSGVKYISTYGIENMDGVKLLIHFLTRGNVSDIKSALNHRRLVGERHASLFAVPRALWKNTDGVELVTGGTCAMVFRVTLNKSRQFLQEFVSQSVEDEEDRDEFDSLLNDVTRFEQLQQCDDRKVFIKVRTQDTSTHFDSDCFQNLYTGIKKKVGRGHGNSFTNDFLETYVTEPYKSDSFTLCIMADRGVPFQFQVRNFDRSKLQNLLRPMKTKILEMATLVFHGDVLPHNFVYDESTESPHLVDFDEGTRRKGNVPRRSVDIDLEENWFKVLLYPNALRCAAKSYTKVQFAASVILFFLSCEGESTSFELERLIQEARGLTAELQKCNPKEDFGKDTEVPESVRALIDQVYNHIDRLLQPPKPGVLEI